MWVILQFIFSPLVFQALVIFSVPNNFQNKNTLENDKENLSLSSQLNELTGAEKHQIEELRQLMGDKLQLDFEKCDNYLIRWLLECDMDSFCASEKLKHTLKWRRSVLLDIMKSNQTFMTLKQDPTLMQGQTKDGGRVMLYTVKGWDIRKLILSGNRENLLKHHIRLVENSFQQSIRRTKNGEIKLTPGMAIANFDGFSIKQQACGSCLALYRDLGKIWNAHYPRIFTPLIVINGPAFAKPFLEIVKSFLSPYFQNALHIFGYKKEEWSQFIFEHVSKEELLEEFGGSVKRTSQEIIN